MSRRFAAWALIVLAIFAMWMVLGDFGEFPFSERYSYVTEIIASTWRIVYTAAGVVVALFMGTLIFVTVFRGGIGRDEHRGHIFEWATVIGAAAIFTYLIYLTSIGLLNIDYYGREAEAAALAGEKPYETIKVIAKQFVFEFEYENGTKSVNELVIRAGKLYRLEVTSMDVVHAFYVPQLGIKYDAIPGYVYVIWLKVDEPGTYDIYCAEYCGVGHYAMVGKLIVTR